MRADWLCVGSSCIPVNRFAAALFLKAIKLLKSLCRARAEVVVWRRYRVLTKSLDSGEDRLVPLTEELVALLREHPDREHLGTIFHFWETGFRICFVWMEGGRPLGVQWLVSGSENHLLRRLGQWSGLYPPLSPQTGQAEGLYAFKESRGKSVADDLGRALSARASALGMTELVTHIVDSNKMACRWAERLGWTQYGTITRIVLKLPVLWRMPICVHAGIAEGTGDPGKPGRVREQV